MFLAEQIRQQQLAAALESRLDSQSFSAMQAALLMNKLKAGAAVAETSKLLQLAAGSSSSQPPSAEKAKKANNKGRNLAMGDKLNKNTVASLLAKSRELAGGDDSEPPELTIEPLFKGLKPDSRYDFVAMRSKKVDQNLRKML